MEVFIWESYGEIDVYDVSTLEDIKSLYKDIDKVISQIDGKIEVPGQEDVFSYRRAINQTINENLGNLKIFDRHTGFKSTQKLNKRASI